MLPNVDGHAIGVASFSDDGRSLAVGTRLLDDRSVAHFGVYDRSRQTLKLVGKSRHWLGWDDTSPVLSPSGRTILYNKYAAPAYEGATLVAFDLKSGTEREVMDPKSFGFDTIFQPSFISEDEIMFSGIGPRHASLKDELHRFGRRETSTLTYRVRLGEDPKLAFPELEARADTLGGDLLTFVSPSRGAKVILAFSHYFGFANDSRGRFRYDVVDVANPQDVKRLSMLGERFSSLCVSADGSTAAFYVNYREGPAPELLVLELADLSLRTLKFQSVVPERTAFVPQAK